MALIHESSGIVVADPTGTYQPGQIVAMVPNQPPINQRVPSLKIIWRGHTSC